MATWNWTPDPRTTNSPPRLPPPPSSPAALCYREAQLRSSGQMSPDSTPILLPTQRLVRVHSIWDRRGLAGPFLRRYSIGVIKCRAGPRRQSLTGWDFQGNINAAEGLWPLGQILGNGGAMMLLRSGDGRRRNPVRALMVASVLTMALSGGPAYADYCTTDAERAVPGDWPACLTKTVEYVDCYAGAELIKKVRSLSVTNNCSYHVKIKVELTILFDYKIDLDPGDSAEKDWGGCSFNNTLGVYHCPNYDGKP